MNWADLPVIIPSFNNPTHLRNMVAQLRRLRLRNIQIVDNASTFPAMIETLAALEREGEDVRVLRRPDNQGPRVILAEEGRVGLPKFFCITDPDLEFNHNLPDNFLEQLAGLTEKHRIGKAGFALDISQPEKLWPEYYFIGDKPWKIWEWEAHFWKSQVDSLGGDPVYSASIDTTFALYNQEYFNSAKFYLALRVAGKYTAKHLPWYREHRVPPDEVEFYNRHAHRSTYQLLSLGARHAQLRRMGLLPPS